MHWRSKWRNKITIICANQQMFFKMIHSFERSSTTTSLFFLDSKCLLSSLLKLNVFEHVPHLLMDFVFTNEPFFCMSTRIRLMKKYFMTSTGLETIFNLNITWTWLWFWTSSISIFSTALYDKILATSYVFTLIHIVLLFFLPIKILKNKIKQ